MTKGWARAAGDEEDEEDNEDEAARDELVLGRGGMGRLQGNSLGSVGAGGSGGADRELRGSGAVRRRGGGVEGQEHGIRLQLGHGTLNVGQW